MPNFVVLYQNPGIAARVHIPGPEANGTFLADTSGDATALAAIQTNHGGKFTAFNLSDGTSVEETLRQSADGVPSTW